MGLFFTSSKKTKKGLQEPEQDKGWVSLAEVLGACFIMNYRAS